YYSNENIGDVFDGQHYKNLVGKGYFKNKHDIALLASIDGFQIFKQKTDDFIPGPKEPEDLNSFLFPAISELHELEKEIECSSYNSYSRCHYCNIVGTYSSHVYYPTQPPKEKKRKIYNLVNLPLRTHNEFKRWIQEIQDAQNIMHLFYKNITGYMFNHWMSSFFTDPNLNDGEYVLTEEWFSWITMYLLLFLKNCLPKKYYEDWGLFVKAKEYYRGVLDRLNTMKMCIHNKLHVSESIFQTGPCCMTWQYPIERFNQAIYEQIFPKIPPKIHDEHLAYTGNGQDFYFPSTQHRLTESLLAKQEQNMGDSELKMVIILGQSGFVGTKIEVDIYANYPKRPSVFKIQDFYAIVEYYLLYEFEESKVMLAYIQWTSFVEEDNVGVKKFNILGSYAFISASTIDHSIGFIEIEKSFYIVDKEGYKELKLVHSKDGARALVNSEVRERQNVPMMLCGKGWKEAGRYGIDYVIAKVLNPLNPSLEAFA
ncbi:20388_t:CDS:10, partial [Gigaspora margarita]